MERDPNTITVVNVSCCSIFAVPCVIELCLGWRRLVIACGPVIYPSTLSSQTACLYSKHIASWDMMFLYFFLFFVCDWTALWARNGLIESLPVHLERKLISAWDCVSCDWVIHFTLSIPIQSQCISCAVHVWGGGKGWRNWGRNESRSFEVLLSSQAKQQAYSYPPKRRKSLAFDGCSVATFSMETAPEL